MSSTAAADQRATKTRPPARSASTAAPSSKASRLIRASGCSHLILRTSWVYAARGGNFARTMLRLAAERDALKVIADQIGAPTGAELLADVTAHAVRRLQAEPELAGTYHCVAGGETTLARLCTLVIEWARAARPVPIKVAPDAIQPIPTSAYPTPARRPLNSRLDTTSCSRPSACSLPHWQPAWSACSPKSWAAERRRPHRKEHHATQRHHPGRRLRHRLHPATLAISKQLLPVYDKPMVYYPLSTLMLAGMRDVLVISTPQDTPRFEALLGDGSRWGMNLSYCVQPSPDGLAQAFILGRDFVGGHPARWCWATTSSTATTSPRMLARARARTTGATVFAYHVNDPERYGVVEFDATSAR
jgi:hypothetical protein